MSFKRKSESSTWTKRRKVLAEINIVKNEIREQLNPTNNIMKQFIETNESELCLNNFQNTSLSLPDVSSPCNNFFTSVLDDENKKVEHFFETESNLQSDEESSYCGSYLDDEEIFLKNESAIPDIISSLREWHTQFNITDAATSDLLSRLKLFHPDLPLSINGLLGKKVPYFTDNIGNDNLYYHFHIKDHVVELIKAGLTNNFLLLQLSFDGLQLFKSSSDEFWTILGFFHEVETSPFLIGLAYCKNGKPNVNNFLDKLVKECKMFEDGLIIENRKIVIKIHAVVCDTPAKAFIKCTKGHSGYYSCFMCNIKGEHFRKMTFSGSDNQLRSDYLFRKKANIEHHTGSSPLLELKIDMVKDFPADYMHLVCLGVVRRLLKMWKDGFGDRRTTVGSLSISLITARLESMYNYIPKEFARKTRSFSFLDRFKATEFRLFLLYVGAVAIVDIVPEEYYKNFLLLQCGMTILLSPSLFKNNLLQASNLLNAFVDHYTSLYGKKNVVHNVHSLRHLSYDAERFGCLDNVSAFVFENYLKSLRGMVRKPKQVLQQVVNRWYESESHVTFQSFNNFQLKKQHQNGPLLPELKTKKQFSIIIKDGLTVATKERDACIKISSDVAKVCNIVEEHDGKVTVVYKKYRTIQDFFKYPMPSSDLNIFRVSNLSSNLYKADVSEILLKFVRLPYKKESYVVYPILHI